MTSRHGSALIRHDRRSREKKLLSFVLWIIWLALLAILWVMLLDTSYDWISSPSDTKLMLGLLILISLAAAAFALGVKGVRMLWRR
jgi:membrane-anchored protein YejM (alkaline phosphatase superfamily)